MRGAKLVKGPTGMPISRMHFKCSVGGCPCRYFEDRDCTTNALVARILVASHTDHPLPKPRLSAEARTAAREDLRKGLTPQRIMARTLLEAADAQRSATLASRPRASLDDRSVRPVSTHEVATRKQLENMSYQLRRAQLPTPDALQNLLLLYPKQILKVDLHPTVRIVFSDPEQLELLASPQHYLLIDTTFEVSELKLYLTTILAVFNGFGVPGAWFLHSSKSEIEYHWFLNFVQEATARRCQPLAVLRDFDCGIRNASRAVWPSVPNFGDFWHLLHDNRKWLARNYPSASKGERNDIAAHLRTVTLSPDRPTFERNLKEFKARCAAIAPPYAEYFARQWEQVVTTREWALYVRPPGIPTGDQQMEAYNHHLKATTLNGELHMKIDRFVSKLYEDWRYYSITIKSPQHLSAVLHDQAAQQNRPRATLASYVPRGTRNAFHYMYSLALTSSGCSGCPANTCSTSIIEHSFSLRSCC